MDAAQKRFAIGLGLGVLGILIALTFSTFIGVVLAAAGVVILGLLAAGYPSPRAVLRGERTLQSDGGDS